MIKKVDEIDPTSSKKCRRSFQFHGEWTLDFSYFDIFLAANSGNNQMATESDEKEITFDSIETYQSNWRCSIKSVPLLLVNSIVTPENVAASAGFCLFYDSAEASWIPSNRSNENSSFLSLLLNKRQRKSPAVFTPPQSHVIGGRDF